MTKELIRAAGGIVHSDGNIFFTSFSQLEVYCKVSIANAQAARTRELFPNALSIRLYYNDLRCQKLLSKKVLDCAVDAELMVGDCVKAMYTEIRALADIKEYTI